MRLAADATMRCAIVLFAPFLSSKCATAAELLLADGTRVESQLSATATGDELTFAVAGKSVAVEGKDLVRFGAFASPDEEMLAVLEGGDLATFTDASLDGEELRLATAQLGELKVPIAAVQGLIFQSPVEVLARDRLIDELTDWSNKEREGSVRITLDNGDAVLGKLTSLTAAEFAIDTTAGAVALPIDRVRAIAFRSSDARSTSRDATGGVRFVVGTTDGSRVTAAEVHQTASGLRIKSNTGASLDIAREHVAAIQTLGGRATYLSDMKATGFKHVPYLTTTWPLTMDRHVSGGRLRAGGRESLKGLGMHSAASATFAIDKPYRRFEAELAIDDSVFGGGIAKASDRRVPRGSVIFRVYVDIGDGKWQLRHTSNTIRGGDRPAPISIDVAKAKRISLIVDFADRADEWDRADWLDARFVD
jgi:hypothetical protein